MSKLCVAQPNEYFKLIDISDISIGEFVRKDKQNINFEYPVFNGGTTCTGYYSEYNNDGNKIIISARGAAGFVNRVFTKYWAGNSCYSIKITSKLYNWNFVYYFLKQKQNSLINLQQGGSIPSVSKKQVEEIIIPYLDIKVQEEIVKILDSFTNLIDALNEELSLRQKQFEYYREKLLSNKYWIKLRISDVCEVINGRAYSQKELLQKGKYRVLRVGNFFSNDSWYYSDLELDDKYYCNNGDLLYAWSATFGPQMWNNGKAIFHYHIWKLDCNNLIRKKYFFYWLSSDYMKEQIKNNTHGATMTHLTKNVMENIVIEVPSLSIQQSIVEKLDAFESLISSLKEEIALRKKQYEYYREKLLTFN